MAWKWTLPLHEDSMSLESLLECLLLLLLPFFRSLPLPSPLHGDTRIQHFISFPGVLTSGFLVCPSEKICVITFLAQGKAYLIQLVGDSLASARNVLSSG